MSFFTTLRGLALGLFLFLLLIPSLLQTNFFKNFLQKALSNATHTEVSFDKIHLSWLGDQKISDLRINDPKQGAKLKIDHLEINQSLLSLLWNRTPQGTIAFNGGEASLNHIPDGALTNIKGTLTPIPSLLIPEVKLDGQAHWKDTNAPISCYLDPQKGQFDGELHALPLGLIAPFIPEALPHFVEFLMSIAGETIDLSFHHAVKQTEPLTVHVKSAKMEGTVTLPLTLFTDAPTVWKKEPLTVQLQGPECSIDIPGQLVPNGFILSKPSAIKAHLAPEQFSLLLPNSLRELVIGLHQPITLTCKEDSFFIPLAPFILEKFQAHGKVDLGKIEIRNLPYLQPILTALSPIHSPTFPIWTTPLFIDFEHSTFYLQRADLLLDNHWPCSIWGKLELPSWKNQFYIGLSPQMISTLLPVEIEDPSYRFTVPLEWNAKGNLTVNQGVILARLGQMFAKKQNHRLGQFLSRLVEQNNGFIPDVPPPTTTPLPWEKSQKP